MSDPLTQLNTTLKQHGQSLTLTRQLVFKALQGKEPQTMHEVVVACEGLANRASIYRVISLYERLGIVQRLQMGWKYKLELSDVFHRHHHHLTCLHCGQTIPLEADPTLEQQLAAAATAHGFTMQEHQLEIQGLCSNCRGR